MAYSIKLSKQERQNRKDVVYGANSHIESLKVALKRYKAGSGIEGQYAEEHYDKLGYYIKEISGKKK